MKTKKVYDARPEVALAVKGFKEASEKFGGPVGECILVILLKYKYTAGELEHHSGYSRTSIKKAIKHLLANKYIETPDPDKFDKTYNLTAREGEKASNYLNKKMDNC